MADSSHIALEIQAPGLAEIFLPQQLLVDDKLFPRAFCPCPSQPDHTPPPLAHIFRSHRSFIEHQLLSHRALFFRGFPLVSATDFQSVLSFIGWQTVPYVGSAPRTEIVRGVFTANDSDPSVVIPFHHEMAQITGKWPPKVLFFCEVNAEQGGQTPIVVSHKVTEKMWEMFPDFMQKLEKLGLLYIRILPVNLDASRASLQGWPLVFGTSDRNEAERRARDVYTARVEWMADGSLKMICGPFQGTRNFGREGQDAWFNMILPFFTGATMSKNGVSSSSQPFDVVFGDGSPLPADIVQTCRKIHEDLSVDIPWQKGDFMIVDNFAVMHGRRAYKPPRKVLVALSK